MQARTPGLAADGLVLVQVRWAYPEVGSPSLMIPFLLCILEVRDPVAEQTPEVWWKALSLGWESQSKHGVACPC